VTSTERLTARDAWQAFRSADPRTILAALPRLTALPHLGAAMVRHLQQFPSRRNGLSRTEQQTLEAVAAGITRLEDVFIYAIREREEAMFMGDSAFLFHISSLFRGTRPLLAISPALTPNRIQAPDTLAISVALTADGKQVVTGELDRIQLCGIDRWLGGVHVVGTGPVWRWDGERRQLRFV
jgi:hypothetical protein